MIEWQRGMTCYWPRMEWGINFVEVTIEEMVVDSVHGDLIFYSYEDSAESYSSFNSEISDTEEGAKVIARHMIQRELTNRLSQVTMLVDLFGNHNWQPIYSSGKQYIRGR